jgi:thiosulfate/3-mercaptopyruvate sulfurtransferase
MKTRVVSSARGFLGILSVFFLVVLSALSIVLLPTWKAVAAVQSDISATPLIQPEELARIVQSSEGDKPLILQVGFHVLYQQAHIPNAEYVGPASNAEGFQRLRKRVATLPHSQAVVLYCGCCPWDKCPNANPAYQELRAMGFKDTRVLYIAKNFGEDWVDKGYPVVKGD